LFLVVVISTVLILSLVIKTVKWSSGV